MACSATTSSRENRSIWTFQSDVETKEYRLANVIRINQDALEVRIRGVSRVSVKFTGSSPGILDVEVEHIYPHDGSASLKAKRRQAEALPIPGIR